MRVAAALVAAALAASASADELRRPARVVAPAAGRTPAGGRDARLTLRVASVLLLTEGARAAVAVDGPARDPATPRACPVDWCQPRVEVPGLDVSRARIGRSELVAAMLDDADLAPLASLVWMVVRTGVEVDWRPAVLGGAGTAAGGGGSVMLWLKLRMDALGRPSFPVRARDRVAPRS